MDYQGQQPGSKDFYLTVNQTVPETPGGYFDQAMTTQHFDHTKYEDAPHSPSSLDRSCNSRLCGHRTPKGSPSSSQKNEDHQLGGFPEGSNSGIRDVVFPVTSARLKPIRQWTRNAIVNIMESGEVCLEFLRPKDKEQRVIEVFLISADGLQVTIYQPESGHGVLEDTLLPVPENCQRFTFDDLPQKYWKKYQYAARFVSVVKSKTAKVILYTDQAKCTLMENSPNADFEASFYDGAKVSVTWECVRIIEKTGMSLVLESEQSQQHLTENTKHMLDYVQKCRKQCMELDAVLSTLQTDKPAFPVIVGRRPATVKSPGQRTSTCPGHSPKGTVISPTPPPTMASFDCSVESSSVSSRSGQSSALSSVSSGSSGSSGTNQSNTRSSRSSKSARKSINKPIYVNNIGWAVQQSNGEMWVNFFDGTQIGVNPSVTNIQFVDQQRNLHRFQNCDVLPEFVKCKLKKLPVVLEHLMSFGAARNRGSSQSRTEELATLS